MQVFVPYPSPIDVAKTMVGDKRLAKQIAECTQILDAINGISKGWRYHPATRTYRGYTDWLLAYKNCLADYLAGNIGSAKWWSDYADLHRPAFLTEAFCDQHKRRLYTKAPTLYPQFSSYGVSEENWYYIDGEIVKYVGGKKVE